MTYELTLFEQPAVSPEIGVALEMARGLAEAAHSENTRASYRSGWNQFVVYTRQHHPQQTPLPAAPALVALFLGHLRAKGRKAQTLSARASAITHHHRTAGLPSPCIDDYVRKVLEGAAKQDAGSDNGRETVTLEDLQRLLLRLPDPVTPLQIRDHAMTLLTFATSRRRSEIAALNVGHLDFRHREFLMVRIVKSKTDQRGVGMTVAVPRLPAELARVCAVRAIEAWLAVTGGPDRTGDAPLFSSFSIAGQIQNARIQPRVVAEVLKRMYRRAGFSDDKIRAVGAHSLRRGFITSADAAGSTAAEIMAVTGHRDRRMLDRYTNHEKTRNPPLLRMLNEP